MSNNSDTLSNQQYEKNNSKYDWCIENLIKFEFDQLKILKNFTTLILVCERMIQGIIKMAQSQ